MDVHCGRTHNPSLRMNVRLRYLTGQQFLFPLTSSPIFLPFHLTPEQLSNGKGEEQEAGGSFPPTTHPVRFSQTPLRFQVLT